MRVDRYHLGKRVDASSAASSDDVVPPVGLSVWETTDPLFGDAPVSLKLVAVTDENAETIASLRSEAAQRAKTPGAEVRVFEDLVLGLVGAAYRTRAPPRRTQVDGAGAPPSVAPASSRGSVLATVAVAVLLSVAGIMALRHFSPGREHREVPRSHSVR